MLRDLGELNWQLQELQFIIVWWSLLKLNNMNIGNPNLGKALSLLCSYILEFFSVERAISIRISTNWPDPLKAQKCSVNWHTLSNCGSSFMLTNLITSYKHNNLQYNMSAIEKFTRKHYQTFKLQKYEVFKKLSYKPPSSWQSQLFCKTVTR